jgi:Na+/melibiose symporter-like transporter
MPSQQAGYLRRRDYVKITLFGFALTALYQSLHTIVLPLRLLDFIPEDQKNTYLGLLTLSGLLLAMLLQPLFGTLSDRTVTRWGRRRPYILVGGLLAALLIPGVGLISSYALLFVVYCLLQVSTNFAQGAFQGLIPDVVPENRHGVASGVKGLLEISGGILFVYLSNRWMTAYSPANNGGFWLVLWSLAGVMLLATVITVVTVREPMLASRDWGGTVRAALLRVFQRDLWRNRGFVWFLISRTLLYMAFTTIQQFALYYLQDVVGVTDPAKATGQFVIVGVVGMILVVWPMGWLSDRIGRRVLNMSASLLGAAGIAIIAYGQHYAFILAGAGIIGVGMGIFNSTNWALATDFAPQEDGARYLGIANMATAGGAVLARAIGPVIDFFNRHALNMGYHIMLGVCLAYLVVGGLLVLKVRPRASAQAASR